MPDPFGFGFPTASANDEPGPDEVTMDSTYPDVVDVAFFFVASFGTQVGSLEWADGGIEEIASYFNESDSLLSMRVGYRAVTTGETIDISGAPDVEADYTGYGVAGANEGLGPSPCFRQSSPSFLSVLGAGGVRT